MITLYQVDNKGQLREWSIDVEDFTIIIKHGLVTGRKLTQREPVLRGLAGRSIDEQITSRINSRVSKQKAKGYRVTIEEAQNTVSQNELNLFKPMLAQQFNKQGTVNTAGAVLQRKLDGNRLLVTRQDGEVVAYTRNGKPVKTLGHIADQMNWLKEGVTVDGEIYKHGMALKDIRGAVAKTQKSTKDLNFHIYDVVNERPFKERFKTIASYTQAEAQDRPNIIIEPYWYVDTEQTTSELFDTVRKQGYEGLMMRLDNYGYQAGKRSKGLLKIKHRYDAEYEVIGVEVSKDGAGILVMRLPNGGTVKGIAPGTRDQKLDVAASPEQYIGLLCTCSFAYLTDFGIPFHLTCDNWRV